MQPIERLFKTELPAFDKDSVYQAVFYADGGAVPNPGFSGFGIHAYFFKEQKDTLKKPVIIANHFMEYFNTNPNAVSYSFVTSEGYQAYDQKTADKFKDKWVTPVCYFDKTVSFFDPATNNIAELSALEHSFSALEEVLASGTKLSKVMFILDSKYVLETVTKYGDAYRHNGWVTSSGTPAKNREVIEPLLNARDRLKSQGVKLVFEWVKGHQGDLGNGMADYQATIGVRRSRAMDNPNQTRWQLAKNYWDSDVERHPLMTMKRGYFNRVNSFNTPGTYYMIEPASEELMIGKRDHEAYAIVKLKDPCFYNEKLREGQAQFGQTENRVILVRNERLYSRFVQKYLREHDHFCLGPSSNQKSLNFLDNQPVALEHNPPALFYRVIEAFGQMESRLEEFEKLSADAEKDLTEEEKHNDIIAHDITSEFYTVEEKKSGKETVTRTVLKPEFNVGYKNHTFPIEETRDGIKRSLKIALALGMDLPNRNALKHLEDHKPQIYLLTWLASPDVLQYAFVIDCTTGISIWSNFYCDRLFLNTMQKHV